MDEEPIETEANDALYSKQPWVGFLLFVGELRYAVYIVLVSAHSQIINLLVEVHELLVIVTYSIYVIADDDGQGTNCKSLLICLASWLVANFKSFEM